METSHPTIEDDMFMMMNACLSTQVDKIPGRGSIFTFLGGPGIGKTQRAAQFAESRQLLLAVSILSRTPSPDIQGFLVPNMKTMTVEFLTTKKFIEASYDKDKYNGVLMMLDEIDKCMPDQQGGIQSMLEDWSLEGSPVDKNLFFMAGANRPEDNCGGNELIKSLEDRMYIFNMPDPDAEVWLTWAASEGIDPRIRAYIQWKPENLYNFNPDKSGAFASPRSWAKSSYLIESLPLHNDRMVSQIVQHKCGEEIGLEFGGFIRMASELCPVEAIYLNPDDAPVPNHNASACYAMACNLAYDFGRIKNAGEHITREMAEAAIKYIKRMDEGLAVFAFKMMADANPEFCAVTEEFTNFKREFKHLNV